MMGGHSYRKKSMPLTKKGKKIMGAMKKQYGAEKGKKVFYASQNKGTISGTHKGSKKKKFNAGAFASAKKKHFGLA